MRVVILLLEMHCVLDLFTGEIHIKRRHYQLIFNIVGAVSDTDYSARKTLNRLVDTEKINSPSPPRTPGI